MWRVVSARPWLSEGRTRLSVPAERSDGRDNDTVVYTRDPLICRCLGCGVDMWSSRWTMPNIVCAFILAYDESRVARATDGATRIILDRFNQI